MIEMSFHNASLRLAPKGDGAEATLNKLADFLERLEGFVWEEVPAYVSSDCLARDPDPLGDATDEDTITDPD